MIISWQEVKKTHIYVRLLTDRLSNSGIFTFKRSRAAVTVFSGFLKLTLVCVDLLMLNILELCPCNLTKASLGHQLCGDFYELFGLVAKGVVMCPEERNEDCIDVKS